jgi:3-phenylpropionate/trans-cinnamate dioxygenase ferredoxin subunit
VAEREKPRDYRSACATDQVRTGTSRRCVLDGDAVLVCNVGGEFFAIADVCTHDHGPLGDGKLRGNVIECPRHGARFDVRDGAVKAPPAIRAVTTFPVRVRDGNVEVQI